MIYSLTFPITTRCLIELEDLPEGLTKEQLIKMVDEDTLSNAVSHPFFTSSCEASAYGTLTENTDLIEMEVYGAGS